jgi:hypothetical protein
MTTSPDVLPVVQPADGVPGPAQGAWTYEDYVRIPEDGNRYEIIDGVLYMAPAPGAAHQKAVARIVTFLTNHVELVGRGLVYVAPFDVELGGCAGHLERASRQNRAIAADRFAGPCG